MVALLLKLLCSCCHVAVCVLYAVGWSVVCNCGIVWSYSKTCVKHSQKDHKLVFKTIYG